MKEYERLTKRDKNGFVEFEKCEKCDYCGSAGCNSFENATKRLAELEDKIENGTLIELPCKVGDTVYFVNDYGTPRIEEYKVYGFGFDKNGVLVCIDFGGFLSVNDVCLTKAEAERKLEELKNENNC